MKSSASASAGAGSGMAAGGGSTAAGGRGPGVPPSMGTAMTSKGWVSSFEVQMVPRPFERRVSCWRTLLSGKLSQAYRNIICGYSRIGPSATPAGLGEEAGGSPSQLPLLRKAEAQGASERHVLRSIPIDLNRTIPVH